MKNMLKILGAVTVVALLVCSAIPVYADAPPVPHGFYGTITIGGSPAPVGTVVTAKVGGVECGSTTNSSANAGQRRRAL